MGLANFYLIRQEPFDRDDKGVAYRICLTIRVLKSKPRAKSWLDG